MACALHLLAMQYTQVRLLKYMISYAVHLLSNAVHWSNSWCPWWHMLYTQVRLLMYMMTHAVHLLPNAVHQSENPETHDGLCSTPVGKCSTPKWGSWSTWFNMEYTYCLMQNTCQTPDVHDGICSTPKWGSWCTWWHIHYTCWQMQYTKVRLLKYMTSYAVHLLPNAVHLSETPDVHDFICSTLAAECGTPKWGTWYTWWHIHYTCWQMQCTKVRLLKNMISYAVHLVPNAVNQSEVPDIHDGISITLAGKCSAPKWGS